MTCASKAFPPNRCKTLGKLLFIRVPLPAAMMTTSIGVAMKFPLDLGVMTPSRAAGAGAGRCTRIIGVLAVLALAGLTQSCSLMKVAYNQAPELVYWHLDSHFDFTDAQSLQVKGDLARSCRPGTARRSCPVYIAALAKAAAANAFGHGRGGRLRDLHWTRAASCWRCRARRSRRWRPWWCSLQPGQLKHLERRFAKGNDEYREEVLEASPRKQRDKRYKEAVKRAEMLYGGLDAKATGCDRAAHRHARPSTRRAASRKKSGASRTPCRRCGPWWPARARPTKPRPRCAGWWSAPSPRRTRSIATTWTS
jgi:hypothetical protein